MKTQQLFIFGATLLMAASCAVEVLPDNEENSADVKLVPVTFNVGSDAEETKVYLGGEDLKKVFWSSDDMINVFDGTSNTLEAFTISKGAGTTSAEITGSISSTASAPYYAMYPYQADAQLSDQTITINIPAEQKAVANSVDPKAFIGVGICTDGSKFQFYNATAFVKFQLNTEDIENLVSVSLSGNDLTYLAGNVNYTFENNSIKTIAYVAGQMQSYVTLSPPNEGWKSETAYYFAIRPTAFAKGFTITAKYSDGACRYLSTDKGVMSGESVQTIARNSTMDLATLPKMKDGLPNDLYIAYLHGQNIDVAGTIINKTDYGDATLHKVDEELTVGSGVHFITETTTITYNNDNAVTKLVVLGRTKNTRSTLKCATGKYFKLNQATGGYAIFHNVLIDHSAATQYFMTPNVNNQIFDTVIFDNCLFKFVSGKNIIYAATATRGINNLTISNCNFDAESFDRVFIGHSTTEVTINNIVVTNNIFKGNSSNSFKISNGTGATYKKIVFKNNSLINSLTADALFNIKTAEEVEIKNNLFHASTATKNMAVVNTSTAPTFTVINNYDYIVKAGDTQYYMKIFFTNITTGYNEFTHLSTSPFSDTESATQTTEYASFGAQR